VTARKIGYETRTEELELGPGKSLRVPLELRRTSAVLFIRTIPAGVRVRLDGELRGTTEASSDGDKRSQTLMIDGLVPRANPYRFQLEKDCFVPAGGEVLVPPSEIWKGVAAPDPLTWDPDLRYEQVSLRPAFGTIEVTADQPGAVVLIDGERRGVAGKPIAEICNGERSVDVRSPTGRFSQPVKVEFDKEFRLQAKLIPTYGVVTAGDRRADVQGVFNAVIKAVRAENLNLVPVELAEADVAALSISKTDGLRALTDRLIQRLDTQGIATLARVSPDAEGQDLELALFARGSSKPDVLRFSLQNESSVRRAVARLGHQVPLVRPGIGIEVVDVMRGDGAVVTRVDPLGPSARAIMPGDVIVSVGGTSIADVTGLVAALEKTADATVSVRLRDKPAPVTVVVERRPNVVSVYESRPFNVVITELNSRLARQQLRSGAASAEEQQLTEGMRLNLAAALMAVGNYSAAEQTLSQVRLESRHGISKGTVDYLRAVCHKQLGQLAEARALFEAASQEPDALLTERGPAVSYLAREELLALGAVARE
jgi:hypothetical protein